MLKRATPEKMRFPVFFSLVLYSFKRNGKTPIDANTVFFLYILYLSMVMIIQCKTPLKHPKISKPQSCGTNLSLPSSHTHGIVLSTLPGAW